jgi:coatomer protein complex subunit gamma
LKLTLFPRRLRSQPLAEKKAPGKNPIGLGVPPSTVDAYEKLLYVIPEFVDFGKHFKVL